MRFLPLLPAPEMAEDDAAPPGVPAPIVPVVTMVRAVTDDVVVVPVPVPVVTVDVEFWSVDEEPPREVEVLRWAVEVDAVVFVIIERLTEDPPGAVEGVAAVSRKEDGGGRLGGGRESSRSPGDPCGGGDGRCSGEPGGVLPVLAAPSAGVPPTAGNWEGGRGTPMTGEGAPAAVGEG